MLIMSLHQGISGWAIGASHAWKNKQYSSALFQSIITRIGSAVCFIFQVCYSPLYLINTAYSIRDTYVSRKLHTTTYYAFVMSVKIAAIALSVLFCGLAKSLFGIIAPELIYQVIKVQKALYAQHIILYVDSHPNIEANVINGIRQHLNANGLQLDEKPFQEHFRLVWKRTAMSRNASRQYGDPDVHMIMQQSLEDAVTEYVVKQLQTLEQIDPDHYQTILHSLPQSSQRPITEAVVASIQTKRLRDAGQLAKILFFHMHEATKDLKRRNCYDDDELETGMGGAYHAVVGSGLMRMISKAALLTEGNETTLELTAAAEKLSFDTKGNVLNFKQRLIDAKMLLNEFEEGESGPHAEAYKAAHDLLKMRLSFPENKIQNAVIDQKRKELKESFPVFAAKESTLFEQIGALIGEMNRRVIKSNSISTAYKVVWSKAFVP